MSRLVWDQATHRKYETGVEQMALYIQNSSGAYPTGVAWDGVTAFTESPSGAEPTDLYANNSKYVTLMSTETFGATIEAYTYPEEWAQCDGSASLATGVNIGQQSRKTFGLACKTLVGNDSDGNSHGYKLHLVYGAMAKPSERAYNTVNDSPEAITFSWELSTTPVNVSGFKPTASLTIDSTEANATCLANLEAILYGVDASEYDSTKTYNVGDYCTHTESTVVKTYKCNTASTTGTWEASKWDEVAGPRLPLPDEVKTIMTPAV